MVVAAPQSSDDTGEYIPRARIDAQDDSYILPLREYLESHGVETSAHQKPDQKHAYHIVAGDGDFVKSIFSRTRAAGEKQLGIVMSGGNPFDRRSVSAKIVFTDPVPIRQGDVTEIFDFLFTGDAGVLDLRRRPQQAADEARIKSLVSDVFGSEGGKRGKENDAVRRSKKNRAFAVFFAFIGLIVVPVVWYTVSVLSAGVAIAAGAKSLSRGDVSRAGWDAQAGLFWTAQARLVLTVAEWPIAWAGSDALRGQERLLSFLTDAASAETNVTVLSDVAQRVASGLLNQMNVTSTGVTSAADITALRSQLTTVQNTLGLAQASLVQLIAERTFPFSLTFVRKQGITATANLSAVRRATADMDKALLLFIEIAGFREPQNYLILLQNSMELRPTGGFIGSVALASFADGRLASLTVEDVYTYDGQLKGHVDPPGPVRDLLGAEHWYLRDSNWDPDFKASGNRAAWFFEKETGTKVNGVIAINSPFIVELLRATGPVDLPDYNDRITADNFYGKSLYYTQNGFFPGSTQKKDFLGALSRALMEKLTSRSAVNVTRLFRAVTTAIAAHDILFTFTNPDVQTLTENFNWAGRIPTTGCTGTEPGTCVFDPLVTVEANLGVNKVNYFVSHAVDRKISVNPDGTRSETIAMTIKNAATDSDNNLPYRAYIRFLVPSGSSVAAVTVDGQPIPERKGNGASALPYAETVPDASGFLSVGVALDVLPSSQKQIVLSVNNAVPLVFGKNTSVLDVFTGKQPGVSDTTLRTSIAYPAGWTLGIEGNGETENGQGFIAKQGQLEYNMVLTRDALVRIRLTKP